MSGIPNSGILQISPAGYPGNGLSLDLTPYLDGQGGDGMDPANATFTERIFSHSLLKEGGVLALENLVLKELRFPLRLFGQGQQAQNLVGNPSFEWDAAGGAPAAWSPSSPAFFLTAGATLSVTGAQAQVGKQALQIVTTASAGEGAAIQLAGSFTAGTTYTFSVWLKGNAGGESLTLALGAASADSASAPVVLTSGWQRFDVIWTPSSNETTVYAVIKSGAASAITVFADAAMVTVASGLTVYQDGDQPGWQWLGAPGNSVSSNYFARDGVAALVQRLNAQVNLPGQTVLWQDQGSSQPTYFDLASGQFDVEYDFRSAGNYWIKGMLRLFCQPLGHTATMRLVASAAGTGPLLMLPIASPILGDAPALIQAQVSGGSFASAAWDTAALAVLPCRYVPEYQASQLQPGASTTLVGASGAVASLLLRQIVGASVQLGTTVINASSALCSFSVYAATPYFGVNRLLAIGRANLAATCSNQDWAANAAFYLQALYNLGGTQAQVGPTAAFTANAFKGVVGTTNPAATVPFTTVDLGAVTIPSSLAAATLTVQLMLTSYLEVESPIVPGPARATSTFDLTDVILLPDAQTVFLGQGGAMQPGWSLYFDGINNESYINNASGILQYRETSIQRGAIPKVPVGASPSLAAVFMPQATGQLGMPANDLISASVSVRERVRFAF